MTIFVLEFKMQWKKISALTKCKTSARQKFILLFAKNCRSLNNEGYLLLIYLLPINHLVIFFFFITLTVKQSNTRKNC